MQFLECFNCCKVPTENNDVHTLDFSNCDLADVPQTVLLYERTLETLLLNSNHIYDLPLPLFHCQSLQVLSISNNDLAIIPAAIGYLVNLRELDVSRNNITDISDSIKKCKKLSVLNASFNPLHHLPTALTQLISAEELYLNDTALEYLPANIGRLSKLIILELRGNKLCNLPKSMSRLVCLSRLDIGQNHFVEFPSVVGTLVSMKELWCDLNEFNTVPSFIGNLKELVHFEIGDNNIQTITNDIDGCKNLIDFSACYCDIQFVPHTIGLLKNLLCLKLDYNSMTSLTEAIGGLCNLEELSLSHNKLKSVPSSIGLLRKLVSLHLDSNKLKKLPPELGSCSSLGVLSLRNNLLESIPAEVGNLSNLGVLILADNKLSDLPMSILKLKKLNALWLSHNQSKPLIPLQVDFNVQQNVRVLTCYLLPQQKGGDEGVAENAYSDEGTNSLKKNPKIRFAINSPQDKVGQLTRAPTPFPKKLRSLSKVAQKINQGKSFDNPEVLENCINASQSIESNVPQFAETNNQLVNGEVYPESYQRSPSSLFHVNETHDQSVPSLSQIDSRSFSSNSLIKTAVVKKQDHLHNSNCIPLDEIDHQTSQTEPVVDQLHRVENSNPSFYDSINNSHQRDSQRRPPPYHIAATYSKKASFFNRVSESPTSLRYSSNRSNSNNVSTNVALLDNRRDSVCSEASSVPSYARFHPSNHDSQDSPEKAVSDYSFAQNQSLSIFNGCQENHNKLTDQISDNHVSYKLEDIQTDKYTNSVIQQFPEGKPPVFKASPYIAESDNSDSDVNSTCSKNKSRQSDYYNDLNQVIRTLSSQIE
ncbi:unnamed protein product [Bemisia tabaci]|uniref:Disease resistance R13L4/SHOC-2-like LRR domain-containing protein n=1 Tax=Bemisia tabaci TaxID=7038 RepID=A0A9N9ZYC2_BEMTA|nr:unnamed protein product [Bemisia tabaci]